MFTTRRKFWLREQVLLGGVGETYLKVEDDLTVSQNISHTYFSFIYLIDLFSAVVKKISRWEMSFLWNNAHHPVKIFLSQ